MRQDERHQIIAIGGSGFLTEPQTLALERYVLSQARSPEPTVCFIPTANGDSDASLVRFYTVFTQLPCRPSHLLFFRRTPADLRSYLLNQDVIYVGGGNTRSMLAVWKEWGLPDILREAWESGIVLAGRSAGAICWFEQGSPIPSLTNSCRSTALASFLGVAALTMMEKLNVALRTIDFCSAAVSLLASPLTTGLLFISVEPNFIRLSPRVRTLLHIMCI